MFLQASLLSKLRITDLAYCWIVKTITKSIASASFLSAYQKSHQTHHLETLPKSRTILHPDFADALGATLQKSEIRGW